MAFKAEAWVSSFRRETEQKQLWRGWDLYMSGFSGYAFLILIVRRLIVIFEAWFVNGK